VPGYGSPVEGPPLVPYPPPPPEPPESPFCAGGAGEPPWPPPGAVNGVPKYDGVPGVPYAGSDGDG